MIRRELRHNSLCAATELRSLKDDDPKKRSSNRAVRALELLLQTLARHSTISTKDQRAIRKLHPRVTTVERGAGIRDRPHVAVMVISGMLARYHTMLSGHRQYLSLHVAGDLPDLCNLCFSE